MAKKAKEAPKKGAAAPKVENPSTENKNGQQKQTTVKNTIDLTNMSPEQVRAYQQGLSPDKYVDLIKVQHETFRMDPKAAEHTGMSQEMVDNINKVNAAMQVSAMVCEVVLAKNPHNLILPQQIVDAMKLVGSELGVSLKTLALPAPDKNGNIVVPSTAIEVSKETKQAVESEAKIVNKLPELNPEKIKDEAGLREAAIYVLVDTKTSPKPNVRLNAAIDLYYSWLYFQAADEAAKEVIKNTPRVELLEKLTKIVGKCPFSMEGMARVLFNDTSKTKSPIPAFCMFRNVSFDLNGKPTMEDATIADFVKVLIKWVGESHIEAAKESIETHKSNIELLSKNKKQNAKAIESEQQKIKDDELLIESYNETIGYVTNPSLDLADNFMDAYDNKDHEDYRNARRMAQQIFKSYYPSLDVKDIDDECFRHNAQQYIGVITCFFRDSLSQSINYKEANIVELKMKEQPKEEPKEEGSKK